MTDNRIDGEDALRPISGDTGGNSIAQWRAMSEHYREQRLSQEAEPQNEEDAVSIVWPRLENFRERLLELLRKSQTLQAPEDVMVEAGEEEEDLPADDTLRVGHVMTRHVLSIIDSTSVEQAAGILLKKKISGLPVVHYLNKGLVGLITLSDILTHLLEEQSVSTFQTDGTFFEQKALAILEQPVRNFMQSRVIEVEPDCPLHEVCRQMAESQIHRVIVTRDKRVKGIFTSMDAARLLAQYPLKLLP